MKNVLFAVVALTLLALTGCSKTEETVVDQNAAKAQPGADTPAAQPQGGASEAAQKAEKSGG